MHERGRPWTRRVSVMSRRMLWLAAVPLALAAGGCALDTRNSAAPDPTSPAAHAAPKPSAPPLALAGRWQLSSPGAGQCAMTFGAPPGAAEGTIAPEGGCPGDFFKSRKWTFEDNSLVLRDHTGAPLGQLTHASGRFAGRSTAGQEIALAR